MYLIFHFIVLLNASNQEKKFEPGKVSIVSNRKEQGCAVLKLNLTENSLVGNSERQLGKKLRTA